VEGTRERERRVYIQFMTKILKPYFDFHIFIIEQRDDNEKFNIGKLKNIGFKLALERGSFDNFIFSDIDTIPDYDLVPYFHKNVKTVLALAHRGTRYQEQDNLIKKPFLGALTNFNADSFIKINGYPNNFWGWGGEDDALLNRLLNAGYNEIYYPENGSIIDIEEDNTFKTLNMESKKMVINSDKLKFEKLYEDLSSWKENGLNNLNYKIIKELEINKNISQITVDLLKKQDLKNNPKLYNFNNDDWKKLKKIVYSKIFEIKIAFV
jgi:predicted glycosyltransferase involved in capsule biosynthesis